MTKDDCSTDHFLKGNGEMQKLTREHDWSQSPLGPIEQWPQSLRTVVDVILHSDTPMLLWWGPEMIQFYNDAFRPSLGEGGKHPQALGQRGEECWPEIWHIIKPMIDRVIAGGAVWRKDQLIPIFRNGRIEDVYWTFGYSPVRDESGAISGILVVCNETTEQVRSVELLGESEQTLRSIVLHSPVATCILDGSSLRADIVNDVFVQLTGKSREVFESQSLWDIFPELREKYSSLLEFLLSRGISYRGSEQTFHLTRHGVEETLYLDFVVEPLKVAHNFSKPKIMVLAIDVTDKVLARHAIEDSEQRYRTLITESTFAIGLYIGPELRIQYINDIMTRYLGKDQSIAGKSVKEVFPEVRGQQFVRQLENVYATGQTYTGIEEEAVLNVAGRLHPFYFNYIFKPLRDTSGRIYGIHHMAMDVTEQVLSRKKVEKSEAMLRNIILKAPVAMCILRGPEFVVEIGNERIFRIWGKSGEKLLNRPIFEGLPEVRNQGFEEILASVFYSGKSFNAEAVPINVPRHGRIETIFVNFLYEAYREVDDSISGVMVVASDVTEQVKARQKVEELVSERTRELDESNKNLKRSNDELAQFAYIASHDLQEPARKIATFTEMLQQSLGHPDARSQKLLHKIEHSSARMLSLIRDVLTYSQLSKESRETIEVDLNRILKIILEDFELQIEQKHAKILSDPLPVIQGIPVQISQLFSNLISNALKFSHKSQPPEIRIRWSQIFSADDLPRDLDRSRNYHRISFSDNGIGFSQKHAQQIFDIFQRLHGKAEYEGTGIGLAMCKKIAQNHGGDITAESQVAGGSVFHVYFPL